MGVEGRAIRSRGGIDWLGSDWVRARTGRDKQLLFEEEVLSDDSSGPAGPEHPCQRSEQLNKQQENVLHRVEE